MEYTRNCPECGKNLSYTDISNYKRAIKNNSVCASCRKMPESLKKTLSEYWTGKKRDGYTNSSEKINEKKYSRLCPSCGKELFYTRHDNYKKAIEKNTRCNHCVKLSVNII